MEELINSVNVLQLAHLKSKLNLQDSFGTIGLLKKVLFSTFFVASFFITSVLTAPTSAFKTDVDVSCPTLSNFEKNESDFNPHQLHKGKIKWLPDGDTIHTQKGQKLRLLHINAPELNPTNSKAAEAYAEASLNKLQQLTGKGSTIYWVYDSLQKDRYKRDLVFVFNQQGQFINYQLIVSGLAQTLIIPPNQMYWKCIQQAEQRAIKAKKGIWADIKKSLKSIKELNKDSGFQLIQGNITKIVNSKKYRWLVLDSHLWVGIKRQDMQYFQAESLNYDIGDKLRLRGYIYESYGKIRVNLRHPAMLLR